MTPPCWRPDSDAQASANTTAMWIWLRAAGHKLHMNPAEIAVWRQMEPRMFQAALLDFTSRTPARSARLTLLEGQSRRIFSGIGLQAWLPDITDDLAKALADMLLTLNIRPAHRLLWPGAHNHPWPRAILLTGASLILCDPPPTCPAALAAAEQATLLIRPPA